MKILIADDDISSRRLLEVSLRKLGHEVTAAKSGTEAWSRFQQEEVPLLISDWMMPDMDGLELCRRVRAENRPKYTYFMLLTAVEGKEGYLTGMEAGADDFITKPFDIDQLSARIRVAERILRLQTEVKQLAGLLPICSYCKKVRDDKNYWQQVEEFVGQRTDAKFTHSFCPECYEKAIRQLDQELGQA